MNKKSARLDQKNRALARHDRLYQLSRLKREQIENKRIRKIEEEMQREEEILLRQREKVG